MSARAQVIRIITFTAAALCVPAVALACPICFQVEDGPVVAGVRAGVGVLMGVTSVVLIGFGAFAVRLARRDGAFPPSPKATVGKP